MDIAIGLLIGFAIVGPAFCWLVGMFNPIGYMGVLPWHVPRCSDCGRKGANSLHEYECAAKH